MLIAHWCSVLLVPMLSGLISDFLIRITAQATYYLLNTDHHQLRIGILPEDSRLSQASVSTLQPIWTESRDRRHPILKAQFSRQSRERAQRHARRPATHEGKQVFIPFHERPLIRTRSTLSSQQTLFRKQPRSSRWEIALRTQTLRLVASRLH